jgi:hypothetical protein
MYRYRFTLFCWSVAMCCLASAALASSHEAAGLYQQHCAQCHGVLRYGGYAPPLIPDTLPRRTPADLETVMRIGLPQTQMPPFGSVLTAAQISLLATHILSPVEGVAWSEQDILASRVSFHNGSPPQKHIVDRQDITLVVERGTGSITVLEGKNLQIVDKFPVGRIHGGPKFTQDYAHVFAATRDGTLVKYDLMHGQVLVQAKVGVNTRNLAIAEDGGFVAIANQLPQNLVLLDGDLRPLRIHPLPGTPSAVYLMPQQQRFLLSLRDAPRLLYVDIPSLGLREADVPMPFEDFTFVPERQQILASTRNGQQLLLYDLDTGRVLQQLDTTGLPHLFSATFFLRQGTLYAALNHIGIPRLSVLNLDTFQVEQQFALAGAGYFARTHPGTPYIWVDTNTDRVQLFHKETLTPVGQDIVPAAGKKAMHVEFSADGRRALVSVWHQDGAVVMYDSTSLTELMRLPFHMPVGKYNARNKTRFPMR